MVSENQAISFNSTHHRPIGEDAFKKNRWQRIPILLLGVVLFLHGLRLDAAAWSYRWPGCMVATGTLLLPSLAFLLATIATTTRLKHAWMCALLLGGFLLQAGIPSSSGVPAALTLHAFILSGATAFLISGNPPERNRLFQLMGLTGAAYSIWSLYCWWNYQLEPELARRSFAAMTFGREIIPGSVFADRNTLPLGHANFNGGVAALFLPLLVTLAWRSRHEKNRLIWFCGLLSTGLLLWSSGSRAGLIGVACSAALAAFLTGATLFSRTSKVLRIGAGLLGAFFALSTLGSRLGSGTAWKEMLSSDRERWELAKTGWRLFLEKPWTGHGVGSLPTIYPSHWSGDGLLTNSWQLHITPLQLAVEGGVIPALLWCALPFPVLSALRRNKPGSESWAAALAVAGYWAGSWFDHQLNVPFIAMTTGILLGLSLSSEITETSRRPRAGIKLLLAVACIAMPVWLVGRFLCERTPWTKTVPQTCQIGDPVALLFSAAGALKHDDIPHASEALRQSLELNPQSPAAWRLAAMIASREDRNPEATHLFALHTLIAPQFEFSPEWESPALRPIRPAYEATLRAFEMELRSAFPENRELQSNLDYRARLRRHFESNGKRFIGFLSFDGKNEKGLPIDQLEWLRDAVKDPGLHKLRALGYFARKLFDDPAATAMRAHLRGDSALAPTAATYSFPSYNLFVGTLEAPPPRLELVEARDAAFDLIWPAMAPSAGKMPGAWLKEKARFLAGNRTSENKEPLVP